MFNRSRISRSDIESSLEVVFRRAGRASGVELPGISHTDRLRRGDGARIRAAALRVGITDLVADVAVSEEFAIAATAFGVE